MALLNQGKTGAPATWIGHIGHRTGVLDTCPVRPVRRTVSGKGLSPAESKRYCGFQRTVGHIGQHRTEPKCPMHGQWRSVRWLLPLYV
jgi:hypothetical protein